MKKYYLLIVIYFFAAPQLKSQDLNCLSSLLSLIETEEEFERKFGASRYQFLKDIEEKGLTSINELQFKEILTIHVDYASTNCLRHLLNEEKLALQYFRDKDDYHLIIDDLNKKIKTLDEYTNLIIDNDYIQYSLQESSEKWIKSFHLYHDNDVFLFSKINKDRDYTGGFRFECTTDKFKMRLFKNFGNTNHFLSYQSIFIGGEGYTPYIRFTPEELQQRNILYEVDTITNFLTPESLNAIQTYMRSNQQSSDRPFASFQYVGRGKYRLHHTGIYRIESLVKVGKVGGKIGKNIQGVIHQDLTTGSQRVLNWEDQIASGGRLAFNVEHKLDLSIFSVNSLLTFKKPIENKFLNKMAFNLNVYVPFEAAIGTVQTHAGTGIGISNKTFGEVSGLNDTKIVRHAGMTRFQKIWQNAFVSMEYNYRYVIHNSMLEGIGFFKPFTDDPLDDEARTVYSLESESVERHLHKLKWHIGFRTNKVTIYYDHVRFINREFHVDTPVPALREFTTKKWYGYGRIGLNFLI